MLSKLFEFLYHKVFINIVVERSRTIVYVQVISKKNIIRDETESFCTTELNNKMYEYINSAISESPFHYISILDTSNAQGAIATSTIAELSTYCDLETSKYICHKNDWTYFTSNNDLNTLQQRYFKIGVDFVFSPFILLSTFFKDKIELDLALYILLEDNYISLCVFEHSKLLYAQHIDMNLQLDSNVDIDNICEVDERSEDEDFQRFLLIQSSVNEYYKDPKYNSKFLENVYIADSINVSADLKKYLVEEMFLRVIIRHIDLGAQICELAKSELV